MKPPPDEEPSGGVAAPPAEPGVWARLTDHSGSPREQASRLIALLFPPTLAPEIARHFRLGDDGLVATQFAGEVEIGDEMARICKGASRETIAA